MAGIFISYRRADSETITGRIHDRLSDSFGEENVFKDVDDILPGADFPDRVREAVNDCNVMLVIIGNQWLSIKDENGNRRLDDPDDWVRIEIEIGLKRGILLIPVLVHNASMPHAKDLPFSLAGLAIKQAVEIREDPDFRRDMKRLIDKLTPFVKSISSPNPGSVEELISQIEDVIPSDRDQIKLEKIIWSEADNTYQVITSDEFLQQRQQLLSPITDPSQDNSGIYKDVLSYYLNVCARPLKCIATLTWWGKEGHEKLIVDMLNRWIAFASEDAFPPKHGMWIYFPALFGELTWLES